MARFEAQVTVKGNNGSCQTKTISFSSKQNLVAAIRREFSDMKFLFDKKYGLEIISIGGITKSEQAGVHFTINGQVPWIIDPQTGKKLYISLYHIWATPQMLSGAHIVLELVSVSCDFAGSVVDARPKLRTETFELESLPAQAAIPPKYKLWVQSPLVSEQARQVPAIDHFRFYLLMSMRNFGGWKKRPRELQQPELFLPAPVFSPKESERRASMRQFGMQPLQERMFSNSCLPQGAGESPLLPCGQANAFPGAIALEGGIGETQDSPKSISSAMQGASSTSPAARFQKRRLQAIPPKLSGNSIAVKCVPLSSISKIRAVIFDLDGVVVDSEKAHLATFNKVLRPLGINISSKEWGLNYTGIGSVRIMEDVFKKNGIKGSAKELVQKRAKAYQQHLEQKGLPQIEGFKEFYSFISHHKVKSIIASGGHRQHIAASLNSIGLPSMDFVGLEDVRHPKPSPEVFLLAARRLGIKPSECIVVEDSLSGVRAAASAGMGCIALSTTLPSATLRGKASVVFKNYRSSGFCRLAARLIYGKKKNSEKKAGNCWADKGRSSKKSKGAGKRFRKPVLLSPS